MPSLIANYQKKQTIVQLKKVYSDLNNAVRLSESENGPSSDWEYSNTSNQARVDCINKYYQPYFQGAKLVTFNQMLRDYKMVRYTSTNNLPHHYLLLNNGVILGFFINRDSNGGYVWIFADINGYKGSNEMGRDQFVFEPTNFANTKVYVKFWGSSTTDLDSLKQNGNYACNSINTNAYRKFNCGRVIELSGWKIPDNYPW